MKHLTKKLKNIAIFAVLLMFLNQGICVASTIDASLEDISSKSNNQIENIIKAVPEYLTKQQYDKFIELTSGILKTSFSDLFLGPNSLEYEQNNIGFWNLTSFKLLKYKQIDNNQVPSSYVQYEDYINYNDVVTYYVSLDTVAKEENKDLFTGNAFYILVFGKNESGEYKLLQWSEPIIQEMIDKKLAYNDGSEDLQKDIQDARFKGIILNGKREQIKPKSKSSFSIQTYPYQSTPIPSTIRVKRASLGTIQTVNFYTYTINVLPNEWTASADPLESLRAGAMCVKMYGWYRCYVPKYSGQGFDVYDNQSDQVYVPGSAYSRSTQAVDYVAGTGICNSSFAIFETQYDAYSHAQYSGKVSQTGANSLANQGYNYNQILSYYYNYSDKSSGAIWFFWY